MINATWKYLKMMAQDEKEKCSCADSLTVVPQLNCWWNVVVSFKTKNRSIPCCVCLETFPNEFHFVVSAASNENQVFLIGWV
jgi:hypothetical protein